MVVGKIQTYVAKVVSVSSLTSQLIESVKSYNFYGSPLWR